MPYPRPLLLLAAVGASAWAAVGVWYGLFAGFALIGEPDAFEQRVGGRQLYWAGAALTAAACAGILTLFGQPRPRRFVSAGALVVMSIVLSLPGWDARDAAIHPKLAPALQAFRPLYGTRLVQEKPGRFDSLGAKSGHLIWHTNREAAAVCAEVERAFRRFASHVTRDREYRCTFDGNRGDFDASVKVAPAAAFANRAYIDPLDPRAGRVVIYLDLYAG